MAAATGFLGLAGKGRSGPSVTLAHNQGKPKDPENELGIWHGNFQQKNVQGL
jgi:hypothetical protein